MTENTTRKKIIEATIQIIEEKQNLEDVTIRGIAEKASISVGLINYHFKSKKNLINVSVREFINDVISNWQDKISPEKNFDSITILILMLQSTGDFLSSYPGISRISISNDLLNPSQNDNTIRTLQGMLPLIKEITDKNGKHEEIFLIGMEIIAAIQHTFLRNEDIKNATGFDFFNKKQRNNYIKSLIIRILSD